MSHAPRSAYIAWILVCLTAVLVAASPFWRVGVERAFAWPAPGAHAERLPPRRVAGPTIGFAGIVLLAAAGAVVLTGMAFVGES